MAANRAARSKSENQQNSHNEAGPLRGETRPDGFDDPPSTSGFCPEKRRLQHQDQNQGDRREENEILDVRGAATYLHCSPSHVSNILNGKIPHLPPIPHVRAGRLRLIRKASLMEWFKAQESASLELVQKC